MSLQAACARGAGQEFGRHAAQLLCSCREDGSTCKEVLLSSADGSARNVLPCFCFVSSIQLREQDTADHLPRSRMHNLQGQAVKGRELAEIVWQALEAVEGELQRTQPRQGAHLLVHVCDLVVGSICAISRSQARGLETKLGGCASSSITEERQAFEVSKLSRERHELVVGDVKDGDVPVLEEGQRELGESAAGDGDDR